MLKSIKCWRKLSQRIWKNEEETVCDAHTSRLPSGSMESVPLQYGWRHGQGTCSICMEGPSNSNIKTILSTNPKLAITLLIFKTHSKATAGIDKGLDAQTNQQHIEPRNRPLWTLPSDIFEWRKNDWMENEHVFSKRCGTAGRPFRCQQDEPQPKHQTLCKSQRGMSRSPMCKRKSIKPWKGCTGHPGLGAAFWEMTQHQKLEPWRGMINWAALKLKVWAAKDPE